MARALSVVIVLTLVAVPLAHAHGNPATEYLSSQLVFAPPDTAVPSADAAQLDRLLAAVNRAGYTLRVALIGTRYDLGLAASQFGHPKGYAAFLSADLKTDLAYHGRALVVMPDGYSVARDGAADSREQSVLDGLPAPPKPFAGATLAAATATAVRALAAHGGVNVGGLPAIADASGTSQNRDRVYITVVALALLAVAGGTASWRRRRGQARRRRRGQARA